MSDHYPDIDRLISLFLSRQASESEKQELQEWLRASTANRELFEGIKKIWSSSAPDEYSADMERIRDQIWMAGTVQQKRAKPPVHRTLDVFYWSKVAATFFIFLLGAGLFSYLVKKNTDAILSETVASVKRENPTGQRSVHMLPDGTQVWLNAASNLVYPERFVDTMRLVYLIGEAFFEVAEDPQQPFVVEAAGIRTQALGTAFNINASPEDDTIKIALLEGKVHVQSVDRVQTAILSPGEELLAPKDNTEFSKQQFNYISTFGWKDGILIFDGADFASFRSTIEKWYGVTVESKGMLPVDWNIRARYQDEDLRHVLRDICFNKNIQFELQDEKVLITF